MYLLLPRHGWHWNMPYSIKRDLPDWYKKEVDRYVGPMMMDKEDNRPQQNVKWPIEPPKAEEAPPPIKKPESEQ